MGKSKRTNKTPSRERYKSAQRWEKNKEKRLARSKKREEKLDKRREERLAKYKEGKLSLNLTPKQRYAFFKQNGYSKERTQKEKECAKVHKYLWRKEWSKEVKEETK